MSVRNLTRKIPAFCVGSSESYIRKTCCIYQTNAMWMTPIGRGRHLPDQDKDITHTSNMDLEYYETSLVALCQVAKAARTQASLGIQSEAENITDPVLKQMLHVAICTPSPSECGKLLEMLCEGQMGKAKLKLRVIQQGVIAAGRAGLPPERCFERMQCVDPDIAPDIESVREHVRQGSNTIDSAVFDELAYTSILMTIYRIAVAARTEAVVGIEKELARIHSPEFALAVRCTLATTDYDELCKMFDLWLETCLQRFSWRLDFLRQGVMLAIRGDSPETIRSKLGLYMAMIKA